MNYDPECSFGIGILLLHEKRKTCPAWPQTTAAVCLLVRLAELHSYHLVSMTRTSKKFQKSFHFFLSYRADNRNRFASTNKEQKRMLNILIADDHSIVRSGLKILIGKDYEASIEEASNSKEITERLKEKSFALAILDINMPDTNSLQLVELIRVRYPQTKIIIFSMHPEQMYAKRYLKMGVDGYLSKEAADTEVRNAIQTVLCGRRYTSAKVSEMLMNDALHKAKDNPFDNLSSREFEVATLLIKGKALQEITTVLNVHTSTIGTHKAHIFEKLNVSNVIELNELAKLYGLE